MYCNMHMSNTPRKLHRIETLNAADIAKRSIKHMNLSPGLMFGAAVPSVQQSARMVIQLLNMKGNASTKRVAEVVEACQLVSRRMESIKFSSGPNSEQHVQANNAIASLNARLGRYKWYPYVLGSMGAESHFKVLYLIVVKSHDTALALEHYAIPWVVNHLDVVSRIRRCHLQQCRKWFFAKTDHQKYCGGNCRQRDAAQGESFKEKRRLYMRKYRSAEAEQDARSKRLAKGKSK